MIANILWHLRHWWHQLGRPQRLALLVGVVVTLARFSLIGKGTMAFVDESRYVNAMLGLRALGQGHGQEFLRYINSMGARPGDGIWRAIPGLGQALLLVFDLNPNAPPSLQVPQVFNVLIVSLNALLLYRIYRHFFSVGMSLLGLALYSTLVNTNLYLRHLLPYDHSLFFLLLALTVLFRPRAEGSVRHQALIGGLGGLSYAIYPGYFMGPMLLLALALLAGFESPRGNWPGSLKPAIAQLVGLLAVLLAFEGLAGLGHTSYWASSRYIATTVTQGSFDEGFSFIGSYFWQVEGWFGSSLLVLFGVGLGLSWRAGLSAGTPAAERGLVRLLTVGFLAWLGYALVVQVGHKLVFYGRTLHFFVPFISLGALVALRAVGRTAQSRAGLYLGGGGLALAHFGVFLAGYLPVDYPCDVAYRAGIYSYRQIAASRVSVCDGHPMPYRLFGPRLRSQLTQKPAAATYQLLNFAYLYPISCYRPAPRPPGRVVADVPYFMKYPAYQFEGHSALERTILQNHEVDFQIISSGN